jgi:hypothetical protein
VLRQVSEHKLQKFENTTGRKIFTPNKNKSSGGRKVKGKKGKIVPYMLQRHRGK